MVGWLWPTQGEMAVEKLKTALAKVDVNLWRGEELLLYQALRRRHTDAQVCSDIVQKLFKCKRGTWK